MSRKRMVPSLARAVWSAAIAVERGTTLSGSLAALAGMRPAIGVDVWAEAVFLVVDVFAATVDELPESVVVDAAEHGVSL